jgi:hypothetical protein
MFLKFSFLHPLFVKQRGGWGVSSWRLTGMERVFNLQKDAKFELIKN